MPEESSSAAGASPTEVRVIRCDALDHRAVEPDILAAEDPLEIRIDSRAISVTMRTPGHDGELALGFLMTEGLIRSRDQVAEVRPYPRNRLGNVIDVFLKPDVAIDFDRLTRHVFASSSCGLCGKASIEAIHQQFAPVPGGFAFSRRLLWKLGPQLRAAQEQFGKTGGLHAAGLFTQAGELLVCREDVGRHNAVDKVVGWALEQGRVPFDQGVLMVSGRASFEIMQKALAARVPIVVAVSAPSSLAVEFARQSGQGLVGFLRESRLNIYAGEERFV